MEFDTTGRRGEALTAGYSILSTRDGGRTWKEHAPYQQFPAPWFYAALAYAAWMAVRYVGSRRKAQAPVVAEGERPQGMASGIEQSFSSDQPVGLHGRDWFGFRDIALRISAIHRHEKTGHRSRSPSRGRGKRRADHEMVGRSKGRNSARCQFNAWHNRRRRPRPACSSASAAMRASLVPQGILARSSCIAGSARAGMVHLFLLR